MIAITYPAKTRAPRRIRICRCPACNTDVQMQRKSKDDDFGLTTCTCCFFVINNSEAQSWLEDAIS